MVHPQQAGADGRHVPVPQRLVPAPQKKFGVLGGRPHTYTPPQHFGVQEPGFGVRLTRFGVARGGWGEVLGFGVPPEDFGVFMGFGVPGKDFWGPEQGFGGCG